MEVNSLQKLGRDLAAEQDATLIDVPHADEVVEQARRRLFDPPQRPTARRWIGPLAVAAALLCFALVWFRSSTQPLSFRVDSEPGEPRRWIHATQERPLVFSDDSSVLLRQGARARVAGLDKRGADVTIERGTATVSVSPRKHARWTFSAGPYDVLVTGTRFDISWQPGKQLFEIKMHEGSVEVRGPTIAGKRMLVSGQSLAEHVETTMPAISSAMPSSSPTAVRPTAALTTASPANASATASTAMKAPDFPPQEDWRKLAAAGDYREAWASAEPHFDSLLTNASASDLAALADVARYAAKGAAARRAYLAVRRRHGSSSQAAHAAFALGLMAFGGSKASAIRWFETYLREAPGGPLAREALGRILEAQQGSPAAPATAQRYLARYPHGPHAELARSLLPHDD